MAGKPAARQGDATLIGGPIVQGSAGVLIGAPGGVACSVCPGGMAVGNPVNPALGAKVLSGETDISLPGPLPFILIRNYSSYQTPTPAPVGLFGPGWQTPAEVSLEIREDGLILNDDRGRSLHFEVLSPGEIGYSKSESLWLARGGAQSLIKDHTLSRLWSVLPEKVRLSPHFYFICNDPVGPWWVLGYSLPWVPANQDVLPQPLPARRTLQSIADRFGRTLNCQRDASGALTGVVDGAGRCFRLERIQRPLHAFLSGSGWGADSGMRLSAVYLTHDPVLGEVPETPLARYEYNQRGELVSVFDRAGHSVRQFEYHPQLAGRITTHRYAGRPPSCYEYDSAGRVISQTNPGALSYRFDYRADSTVVTDSLGRQQTYHFTGKGGLRRRVKHQHADGSTTTSEYDGSGRLLAQIDAAGRKTEFDLDVASGRLLGVTTPDGRQIRYGYNSQGQVLCTILPDGTRIEQQYDALGRLTASTDPMNRTTRYHYADDTSDLPVKIEDPSGGDKTLSWTPYAQLSCHTDCSGKQTRYDYDRFGQTTRIAQEEGMFRLYRYDARGRPIESENAAAEVTAFTYNEAGDRILVRAADGSVAETTFNAWGQPTVWQSGGLIRKLRYDPAGRLIALTNENGAETRFRYDLMDRQIEETGFDGRVQRYHYGPTGLLVRSEDQHQQTLWRWDESDRLVSRERPAHPDGTPDSEYWHYNEQGLLTATTHHSNGWQVSTQYQYNAAGELTQERQTVTDVAGNTCWQYAISHEYDALGLRTLTTPDGLPPLRLHTYGSGHLLGLSLGDRSLIEFDRDNLHRERERRFGRYSLDSDYTLSGQLAHQQVNADPCRAFNRTYRYDKRGQLTEILSADSTSWHYQYDRAGRLTGAGNAQQQRQYRYDLAGNPLLPNLLAADGQPDTALRDNRLSEDGQYRYEYDRFGNLLRRVHRVADEEHHYAYDRSHRLIHYRRQQGRYAAVLEAKYIYDLAGRRVGKQVVTRNTAGSASGEADITWYGWDGDRLVLTERRGQRVHTVYHPGSFVPLLRIAGEVTPTATSLADNLARQAQVTLPADITGQLDRIEAELKQDTLSPESQRWLAQTGLKVEALKAFIEPQAEGAPRTVQLYHCDHLGTPQALINLRGEADWQIRLDPWGNVLSEDNPGGLYQPIRMQGQHYDEESGLHYNRYRYYDPHSGRYITQDPIGLLGGMNSYQYSLNPVQEIDPLGLDTLILVGGRTEGNPLGHTAMAFTGKGTYSYATGTQRGSNVTTYLADQAKRRSTTAYTIKTTPEQEQAMADYIDKNYKLDASDYGYFTHNCATMVIDAMYSSGVARDTIRDLLTPKTYSELVPGMPAFLPSTVSVLATLTSSEPIISIPQGGKIPSTLRSFNP